MDANFLSVNIHKGNTQHDSSGSMLLEPVFYSSLSAVPIIRNHILTIAIATNRDSRSIFPDPISYNSECSMFNGSLTH
jgi:hypothetical protein